MRYAIRWVIYAVFRFLVWLRYRVRVKGMESLRGLGRNRKVLVLPNHPGYADPMLVLTRLGQPLDPRPLVFEGTYVNPVMWPIMKVIDALRVPDMESASSNARETAQASVQAIIDGLRAGNNHILWPSGRLQRNGTEVLGGARALTDILQAVTQLQAAGFGFGERSKAPGRFYDFDAVSGRTPDRASVNTRTPSPGA